MIQSKLTKTIADLKQELSLVENKAKEISAHSKALCKDLESFKIEFLTHHFENQIKTLALQRGVVSIAGNRKQIRNTVLVTAGASILGGLLTRDKYSALNSGLSILDGMLQRFGDTKWAVSLGRILAVVPEESILVDRIWVTWESLKQSLKALEVEAQWGKKLGSLDSIISKLKRKRLRYVCPSRTSSRVKSSTRITFK